MVLQIEKALEQEEIIRTDFWELPESSLDGWRPKTAFIDYRLLVGPQMKTRDHGLNLSKDLMGGMNGPRGSCKSITQTFFIMKKMRSGKIAWTNYPISFFVIEPDGSLTYHESRPLDVTRLCNFSPELRRGVVGITELQYYVESRTSGRLQNRMLGYQIMQIRKTANSFFYDVQDQSWVDKRFGWSNDFEITCKDVSKQNYDPSSLSGYPNGMFDENGDLREGAISLWSLRDISGILTGQQFRDNKQAYDDIEFDAWYFWNTFPTHFIVDAWQAYHSLKTEKDAKREAEDSMTKALEMAINELLAEGNTEVPGSAIWERASTLGNMEVSPTKAGAILRQCGITKRQKAGGIFHYNIGSLLDENAKLEVGATV